MLHFSSNEFFQQYWLTPEQDYQRFINTCRVWETPSLSYPNQVAGYFRRMCDSCSRQRRGDILGREMLRGIPSLFCSRCVANHKLLHFSDLQKRQTKDWERVCIGHEGVLKICDELYLSIHQVTARAEISGAAELVCPGKHDKHQPKCAAITCPADCRPRSKCYRDVDGNLRLRLSFTTHIKLKRTVNGSICPHKLRKALEGTVSTPGLGFWQNLYTIHRDGDIRAFDPNICDCVDWFAASPSTKGQKLHRPKLTCHSVRQTFLRGGERMHNRRAASVVADDAHINATVIQGSWRA